MSGIIIGLLLFMGFCIIMAIRSAKRKKDYSPASNSKASNASYLPSDTSGLHEKAMEALNQNLITGEPIKVVIHGLSDSAMVGTDRRVFVFKKGMTSGVWFGTKLSSWDYRNLSGVQIETGWATGFVALQGQGIAATDMSVWDLGGNKESVWNIPSAIPVGQIQLEQARQGVSVLRQLISHYQQPHQVSDLETLARLRDQGIITDAEFEGKKKQILGI